MGKRRDRFDLRLLKQKEARSANGPRKAAERGRRDARLRQTLARAKPPYSRVLRNWLAAQLGKPEAKITPADVAGVLKASAK